jgi:hypothetical protein
MYSRRLSLLCFASLAPALLAGCPDKDSHDCGDGPPDAMVGDAPLTDATVPDATVPDATVPDATVPGPCQGDSTPSHKLDLLFLVDNSGSMGEEQSSLLANFPQFVAVLQGIEGGLPDLHIGVISSDFGVGGFSLPGCTGNGDNGELQHAPRIEKCVPPDGAFISDEIAADGSRVKNYTGDLADTFSCIAKLGTEGCGFEQPLASIESALDPANLANAGFLRPDAYLGIIIISDEDDCSARDATIFDPSDISLTGTLGPLESFRCTEFGITCDEGNITRTAGVYTGCRPRTDSPYLRDPQHYVDLLKNLKCDPNKLIISGIIGNVSDTLRVRLDGQKPKLVEACSSTANGTADPAVRIKAVLDQFTTSTNTSICNNDLSAALQRIAERLAGAVGP